MNTTDSSGDSAFHSLKGAIKRKLGWLTADRDVEAEGAAEEALRAAPSDSDVEDAKHEIKTNYGEAAGTPPREPEGS